MLKLRTQIRRKGFTLIELMIVIAIISVLAAIGMTNMTRARAQAQWAGCISNLKNIGTALNMYANDNGGRFPTALTGVTPSYLKSIPTCPSVGFTTYLASGGYSGASSPDAYTVICTGTNHPGLGDPGNYPQFTQARGIVEP